MTWFLLVFVAPPGFRGEEGHTTSPAPQHQQKTLQKPAFNYLILLAKFTSKTA
jgi:hypothetical protein